MRKVYVPIQLELIALPNPTFRIRGLYILQEATDQARQLTFIIRRSRNFAAWRALEFYLSRPVVGRWDPESHMPSSW